MISSAPFFSILPTKDGGRTQALSRRWRHLWRSAPLNLTVCSQSFIFPNFILPSAVSKIIAEHPGPARRFFFLGFSDLYSELESWFHSRALANLQELTVQCFKPPASSHLLLPSLLRSASTLLFVTISHINFPDQIAPCMCFPLLKQLSLLSLSISGGVFHDLLSRCHALESLFVSEVRAEGCLRVSSATLRSIGLEGNHFRKTELVIEDASRLKRLLFPRGNGCRTIRIMREPKLEILGPFSGDFSKIQVFKGLSPVSMTNSMCTVKVLAVGSCSSQLIAVLSVLRFFPCLEKLYVTLCSRYEMDKKCEPQYDPLHPIECLQTHLKEVVLRDYSGHEKQVDFARFFVLNAKVLMENSASRDVQFEIRSNCRWHDCHLKEHIHNFQEDSIPLISSYTPLDANHPPSEVPIVSGNLQDSPNDNSEGRGSSVPIDFRTAEHVDPEDEYDDPIDSEAAHAILPSSVDDACNTEGSVRNDDADHDAFIDASCGGGRGFTREEIGGGFADEDDLFDIDEGIVEPPAKKTKSGVAPPDVAASEASVPKAAHVAQV
ncbi:putative FBD-associated F-box protein At5g22720 [Lolium rigidum]|uniref:putative FBD-associated F-box protein At5g22720 n=1 Tax=Lolium rigidum TaxID=89674 RepID=UPI001F5D1684|nr:putative FBD-associated F-box protein At5g22720 [Lolium rigidum]